MKYGTITIDAPHSNRGNRLIEWSLKQVLGLPEPAEKASMFAPLSDESAHRLNHCDFVLLAGSTILADAQGNSDAMKTLEKLCVPIFCASGSGWFPYAPYLGVDTLRHITPPMGVRDPHALEYCKSLGLDAVLVGCPTAYIQTRITQKTKIVFGFGRTHTEWQKNIFSSLRPAASPIVSCQEESFSAPLAEAIRMEHFTYEDPSSVYDVYARAISCVTGRLHGALPAISQMAGVCFLGDPLDSRFSLLSHLGVPINPMESDELVFANFGEYERPLSDLKASFLSWGEGTIGRYR